jgi:hypothetical protein
MLVAGTAAAVGLTLANDRRLAPATAQAAPPPPPSLPPGGGGTIAATFADPRTFVLRNVGIAMLLAAGGILLAALIPAMAALAVNAGFGTDGGSTGGGAPVRERAVVTTRPASSAAGNWERSYSAAQPAAGEIGAALLAGAAQEQQLALENGLRAIAAQRAAAAEAARAQAARTSAVRGAVARPQTLNGASGYAIGTIVSARITIYGCTGPGGGFCGNMASGVRVFEGAAACSRDLPMGTKLRIVGDPTGRVYECLDRGALKTTWVDVFFNNTSEGIRWQSLLGGTVAQIEIVN